MTRKKYKLQAVQVASFSKYSDNSFPFQAALIACHLAVIAVQSFGVIHYLMQLHDSVSIVCTY